MSEAYAVEWERNRLRGLAFDELVEINTIFI